MANVSFTANLARHRAVPSLTASGATLAEVMADAFAGDAILRAYILDEHGRLRKHVNIFVDGHMVSDRVGLSDPVGEWADIYVMQALSGG